MDTYNVLLIGSGGREHSIAWKLAQSEKLGKLYTAPGNPGTAQFGTNVDVDPLKFEEVETFVVENKIELVVVGPEAPLVAGIADFLSDKNIPVFGPKASAAMLLSLIHI